MAWKAYSAAEIEAVAADMEFVAAKLRDVAAQMQGNSLPELTLQAESAFGVFRSALIKLAANAESEFRDQLTASRMGTTPGWLQSRKRVEARQAKQKTLPADLRKRLDAAPPESFAETLAYVKGQLAHRGIPESAIPEKYLTTTAISRKSTRRKQ